MDIWDSDFNWEIQTSRQGCPTGACGPPGDYVAVLGSCPAATPQITLAATANRVCRLLPLAFAACPSPRGPGQGSLAWPGEMRVILGLYGCTVQWLGGAVKIGAGSGVCNAAVEEVAGAQFNEWRGFHMLQWEVFGGEPVFSPGR